jgi:3',5'-cyclic AMP phosphodiesterase CpdA
VRVLHFTDLHLFRPPPLRGLLSKRLLGTANLYLARRVDHFSDQSIASLVQAILALDPDVCLCTGDLTGMASQSEFDDIRAMLEPVLQRFPTAMIPGNHDVYTKGAERARRFERSFGEWAGGGRYPALHRFDGLRVIGLHAARPHPILASGHLPAPQLEALSTLLDEPCEDFTVLMIHYPLRGRDGRPYGNASRHLDNAVELEALLRARPGVDLIVHGHEHHGFQAQLETPRGPIPIYDPGAGGRSFSPPRNETAHFNVYEIEGRRLTGVERWALDGERFAPEPGGPYATGR